MFGDAPPGGVRPHRPVRCGVQRHLRGPGVLPEGLPPRNGLCDEWLLRPVSPARWLDLRHGDGHQRLSPLAAEPGGAAVLRMDRRLSEPAGGPGRASSAGAPPPDLALPAPGALPD